MVKCTDADMRWKTEKELKWIIMANHFTVCGEKCKGSAGKRRPICTCGVTYECPMKACEYKSEKDGKCPKCGMALKKVEAKPVYKCTSEGCKFTSDKEGKCPHCKTD